MSDIRYVVNWPARVEEMRSFVGLGEEDRQLGPAGFITTPGKPEETAAAIVRLCEEPGLRDRMSAAAWRICSFVMSFFTWSRIPRTRHFSRMSDERWV